MLTGLVQSRPSRSTTACGVGANCDVASTIGRNGIGLGVFTSRVLASIARTPRLDTGILPCVIATPLRMYAPNVDPSGAAFFGSTSRCQP